MDHNESIALLLAFQAYKERYEHPRDHLSKLNIFINKFYNRIVTDRISQIQIQIDIHN